MKRFLLLSALIAILIPSGGALAQAMSYDIQLSACQESDGTYTAKVTAYNDGSFWTDLHLIDEFHPGPFGQCMGSVPDGWTQTVTGLTEGTDFSAFYWVFPGDVRTITLDASLPSCGKTEAGDALFNMYLLTGEGKYCILISETHPSVERQKAACFPGEEWVASRALCSGGVYADDSWKCDSLGYERAPLSRLLEVHERRQ